MLSEIITHKAYLSIAYTQKVIYVIDSKKRKHIVIIDEQKGLKKW